MLAHSKAIMPQHLRLALVNFAPAKKALLPISRFASTRNNIRNHTQSPNLPFDFARIRESDGWDEQIQNGLKYSVYRDLCMVADDRVAPVTARQDFLNGLHAHIMETFVDRSKRITLIELGPGGLLMTDVFISELAKTFQDVEVWLIEPAFRGESTLNAVTKMRFDVLSKRNPRIKFRAFTSEQALVQILDTDQGLRTQFSNSYQLAISADPPTPVNTIIAREEDLIAPCLDEISVPAENNTVTAFFKNAVEISEHQFDENLKKTLRFGENCALNNFIQVYLDRDGTPLYRAPAGMGPVFLEPFKKAVDGAFGTALEEESHRERFQRLCRAMGVGVEAIRDVVSQHNQDMVSTILGSNNYDVAWENVESLCALNGKNPAIAAQFGRNVVKSWDIEK